jgi:hypothetical protein
MKKEIFIKELNLINKLKNSIINNKSIYVELEKKDLKNIINYKEIIILSSLGFHKIQKTENTIILTFNRIHEKNWLDERLGSNYKSCRVHLIFSDDVDHKEKIISYEQYSECNIKNEKLKDNWTYLLQLSDCN